MTESESFAIFVILAIIVGVFVFARGGRGAISATGRQICATCGVRGEPATKTRGSIWIEIILWLCLIVPGLIYSIWRLTTRQKVCPSCGNAGMIPIVSPRGQQLAQQFATRPAKAQPPQPSPVADDPLPDKAGLKTYRVVLDGNTLPGFAPEEVRRRLAALIGRGEDTAARLLGGRASTVKKGIDEPTALRYVEALKRIGVACRLEHETLDLDLESLHTAPLSSVGGGASSESASPASVGSGRVVPTRTPTSLFDTTTFKVLSLVVAISLIIGTMFLVHVTTTGRKSPSSLDESAKTTLPTPDAEITASSPAQEDRIRAEIASTKAAGEARDAAIAAKFKAERGNIIAKLKQLIAARKYQEAIDLAYSYAWAKDRELDALKKAAVDKNREVIIAKEKAERKKQGVTIGMTQEEVIETMWGKPSKINRTATANHIHEQWVYGDGGDRGLLYFDDGILTAIQN